MARSVEDLFKAADEMIEWLLGTEVTEEDIVTALEQSCPDWSEKDRKDVLTLAAGLHTELATSASTPVLLGGSKNAWRIRFTTCTLVKCCWSVRD